MKRRWFEKQAPDTLISESGTSSYPARRAHGSDVTRSSITMAYRPLHDRCHLQPTLVPGALRSRYSVACSAERGSRQRGQRGDAVPRKLPPHRHGRTNVSTSGAIGPWNRSSGIFGTSADHALNKAVLPHASQYAYAESLNPLWTR